MIRIARIVGATDERTRNLVVVDGGQKTHVHCGADVLLSGLYQDVSGTSICPVCGKETRMVIVAGRLASVDPQSALLHYVVEDQRRFSICCEATFVFDKEECLKTWLGSHDGASGKTSSLPEFMNEASARRGPR
ncbi:MAG: hypothetical protein KGI38_02245 [Thaumarchaeota archaeon]|nr:hypothetical protein [Nitrososphaerota archaeon]